jgi:DNA modification methylase
VSDFSILQGDVLEVLRSMPSESVHCCVTSPPYFGLRDYGTARWEGGDPKCAHRRCNVRPGNSGRTITGKGLQASLVSSATPFRDTCRICGAVRVDPQVGLERTPGEYIERLVAIFREVRRVLRSDGTLWLNLGDSYTTNGGHADSGVAARRSKIAAGERPEYAMREFRCRPVDGLKPKDLMMIPARVAIALQDDGWYLRSDIIWAKPNPMPESVTDRPTKAHEYLFLLAKSERYYYDREAVLEPLVSTEKDVARIKILGRGEQDSSRAFPGAPQRDKSGGFPPSYRGSSFQTGKTGASWSNIGQGPRYEHAGRNRRSVWTVATEPFPGAHFATFPTALVEPCILAGTSEAGCCPDCGQPWERVVLRKPMRIERSGRGQALGEFGRTAASGTTVEAPSSTTSGWRPPCRCYDDRYRTEFPAPRRARKRAQRAAWPDRWRRLRLRPGKDSWPAVPCTVLDTFCGSGTTGLVATRNGRNFRGIELNPNYCEMSRRRITSDAPLLNVEVPA